MNRWFACTRKVGLFALVAIGATAFRVMAGSEAPVVTPQFSWEKVPQWLIVRKAKAFTASETEYLSTNPIVVFEKANGTQDAASVEEAVLRAARGVKAVNPRTATLFYWNAVINYPGYRANEEFKKNLEAWALKKEGKTFLFKGEYPIYDLTNKGWQDWWVTTAKEVVSDPAIDGLLIDAICKTNSTDDGRRNIYPGKEYGDAYFKTATRLKGAIGSKLLVGNAIRVGAPRFNLPHLQYLDGSYVERWAVPMGDRGFEEYVAEGMKAMSQALAGKKLILFNSGPDAYPTEVVDPFPNGSYAEKEAWMKKHIGFPLAVFLMVAEEGAYFHWGSGPNALPGAKMDVWRNDIYDELNRPLGKPLGPATKNGNVYTRSFEHLDVRLELDRREASFDWH